MKPELPLKRWRVSWLRALLLTAFVIPALAQDTLPRTALVMGVGDYGGAKFKGGSIPNLPGITTADLPGMEAKLKSLGFSVTVVANPSLSEAKEAVDAFSARIKASPGVSLFYFSGHGGEYEGKNYLIPRGANIGSKADLSDEALSAQRVLNGMEESGAQVNLVFLDCCREDLGKSVGGAEMAPLKAKGSFIGFATRSGGFADPGEEGSPYTRFLLKHLDKPGLSVADMYSLVIGEVKDYSKRVLGEERRPGFYSELDAPFYFVPVKFTPGEAPALTALPVMDQAHKANIEDLESFMRMHFDSYISNNPSDWSSLFAEYSIYGYYEKKSSAPRSYIFQDRLKYINQYPIRTIEILNNGKYTVNFLSDKEVEITYMYKYAVSGKTMRTGVATVELTLYHSDVWKIIKYNEKVIRY